MSSETAIEIQTTTESDVSYIVALQKKFSNQVGFVPTTAIHDHISRRHYTICKINGQHSSYILQSGGTLKTVHLIQVAVEEKMWRSGIGTAILDHVIQKNKTKRYPNVTAYVREDLQANSYFTSLGFQEVRKRPGGIARGKLIIEYVRLASDDLLFDCPAPL